MAHISLLAFPGCSMATLSGPVDAFSIANLWCNLDSGLNTVCRPLFSWDIVTTDGKPVSGSGGITIQPNCSIYDVSDTDIILIPGFLPPFNFFGKIPEKLTAWFMEQYSRKAMIGTVCTGSFFLAETGLLNGKTATTNWLFARNFKKRYPRVNLKPERLLVEDSGIICSGATTSFLDLCLHIIKKFGSDELAVCCSKSLLMEPNRRLQSPYVIFDYYKNHGDEKILQAQTHMEENFRETISIEELASDLGISPRHFKRRFKRATEESPLAYLQRVRIEAAKQKLELTKDTIDEITWQVGYEDSNSFRRLFKKSTGFSPKEYRLRFARIKTG